MAWQKRGGNTGPLTKWKDVGIGAAFEGKYLGMRNGKEFQGKMSKIASLKTASGEINFPCNTVLQNNLSDVPVGAMVRIVHLGMQRGQGGVEYRNFDIFVDDGSALGAAPAPSAPAVPAPTGIEALEKKLRDSKGDQVASLMIDALKVRYPAPADYEKAVRDLLVAHGVQV